MSLLDRIEKARITQSRQVTMTMSVRKRDALRTAFYIIAMCIRHPRSTVTFTLGQDL